MLSTSSLRWIGSSAATALTLVSTPAHAHISLEGAANPTHESRYGATGDIKTEPCGAGTPSGRRYTYQPGETITIHVAENIPHPSYYRIAFDDDGDDGFVDPVSIMPIPGARARPCPISAVDRCNASDFYNNDTVLPGMDNLEVHLSAGQQDFTFEVTLPDVQCENCTLQIIQVMHDDLFHGPYNTDRAAEPGYIEDVYHTCIDVALRGEPGEEPDGDGGSVAVDAGPRPDAGVRPDAGRAMGSIDASVRARDGGTAPTDPGEEEEPASGGMCSVGHGSNGSAGLVGLMAVGLLAFARRRRAR